MFVSRIFVIIIVLMSTWYCSCSPNRVKRIINGWKIVGREGPYDAIKYTVAIADVHTKPWWVLGLYFEILADRGVYGFTQCGGALLTPLVVQTACHCVARFRWVDNRRRKEPRVNHQWEDKRVIYVGLNNQWEGDESMMTTPYLESREYFPHQECVMAVPESLRPTGEDDEDNNAGAGAAAGHPETVFAYDFALIKVKKPEWVKGELGVPTTNVAFAPMYTRSELESMAEKFSALQPVCLSVGWGNIDKEGTDTNSIRAGWTQMMSMQDCIDYTASDKHGGLKLTEDEVKKYVTWFCTERFPLNFRNPGPLDDGGTSPGDSGDPITCYNAYTGIVAGAFRIAFTKNDTIYKIIFYYSAIKFTLLENASNYRRHFDIAMESGGNVYREIIRELKERFGDEFVEHLEEAVFEEGVERVVEQAIEAVAVRSGNQMFNNPRSRSAKRPTSITRKMLFERAFQSVSDKLYGSPVLLVFTPIALPFLS